ncbi:MAG: WecB/TagA/CpsF family glycosyltransferase [Ilumatobacteraceae bacterium]
MGVPIDDVTIDEAVDRIAAMVEVGRSTGRVHQVVTVNVDFVVNAHRDGVVLDILQRSDLSIADGMPLVWASRVIGSPVRERTTGVDLVPAIVERAAADGLRVVFFGGAPTVAARAADILRTRAPEAQITTIDAPLVGADGSMEDGVATELVQAIRDARPDVVCVALGNPKQERWIRRFGATVGAPVLIGIGGSLDFITGSTRRAPPWMQRAGLEWMHRAVSEPRRLIRRYARDIRVFLPGVAAQAWRGRRREAAVVPSLERAAGGSAVLRVLGPVPRARPGAALTAALSAGDGLTFDVSNVDRFDNVTVSALVGMARQLRRVGGDVTVVGAPDAGDPADIARTGAVLAAMTTDDRVGGRRDRVPLHGKSRE